MQHLDFSSLYPTYKNWFELFCGPFFFSFGGHTRNWKFKLKSSLNKPSFIANKPFYFLLECLDLFSLWRKRYLIHELLSTWAYSLLVLFPHFIFFPKIFVLSLKYICMSVQVEDKYFLGPSSHKRVNCPPPTLGLMSKNHKSAEAW